jgi:ABC-type branched-subunit amino acid transport system substrate-binding protein
MLLFAAALTTGTAWGAGLSEQEARGKEIFLHGESPTGRDITAYVGQASVAVSASAMPCASCHGPDGLGRPEAGVTPSNITWSHLTKPYGTRAGTGRRRPPYTVQTVTRAIQGGIDAAGNRLNSSMPRYEMDPVDMTDLLAYMQRLERDLDPGLTDTAIRVGTVVPRGGPTASLGEAIVGVLKAFFADVNAQGGIYGRRLELEVTGAPTRDLVLDRVAALVERGETLALVAPVTAGLETKLDDLAEQKQLPVIGPFTQFPADADTLERFTFYLFGGLTVQATALVDYAAKELKLRNPRVAVVYPRGGQEERAARAIQDNATTRQWPQPLLVDYPPGLMNAAVLAATLQAAGRQALVFLGPGPELVPLAYEGARRGWVPYLLLAGSLASRTLFDLPTDFQDRIFLVYPTLPSDHTVAGKQEFGRFHQRHNLPRQHLPAQIAAYTAAKLLVHSLKEAGRGVSREKLIQALEALHRFDTGLTPPLTYSANRRIGALGAHIVTVDLRNKRFRPGSTWVEPD